MSILREYQRQALDAFWTEVAATGQNRLAIVLPTGTGKTVTFAAAADQYLDRARPSFGEVESPRVLVLVHTDELVNQAVEKIRAVTRGRWSIGVVKAKRNDVDADIVVASVQTLARPERREQITNVGFIIVDECHHAVADTYRSILIHFGAMERTGFLGQRARVVGDRLERMPVVPVLGVTATLARSDGQGLGKVWQDVAFTRSLPWAIRKGFLVDLVPYTIRVPGIDAGASDAALDAMIADSIAPEAVVDAWLEYAWSAGWASSSTVLFAPLVRSAEAFAEAFNEAGVKAEVVHGKLPDAERQAILERYEQGVTTVICNAMVLTEGWDSPRTKCVVVARPTQSASLLTQMVGRGLRPWLGAGAPAREEQHCVVLCVAGATNELATVADLSDRPIEQQDGKSLLQMHDEWDLGRDLTAAEAMAYRGPVVVERWDEAVQRSSKAWKHTAGGVPFLPTAKRGEGYVFVVRLGDEWEIWYRRPKGPGFATMRRDAAPDLELAMALAEDEAQELGGDIGRLLADKSRAWRKVVPSEPMQELARRAGVPDRQIQQIMTQRAGGKAGKLSDLIDKVTASRVLDPVAQKIRERAKA